MESLSFNALPVQLLSQVHVAALGGPKNLKKPRVFGIFGLLGPRRRPKLDSIGQEAPKRPLRGPQGAPRCFQEAPKGPPRGPQEAPSGPHEAQKRPQEGLQDASNLPPRGPREANHETPTNIHEASDPPPRHGGGMGRRPIHTIILLRAIPTETVGVCSRRRAGA